MAERVVSRVVTLDVAVQIEQRLEGERMFLDNMLRTAPVSLRPALEAMRDKRATALDEVSKRIQEASIEVSEDALRYAEAKE